MTNWAWAAIALLVLQPFLVAIVAAQKQLSGGIWFMVAFMWTFVGWVAWLLAGAFALAGISEAMKSAGIESTATAQTIAVVAMFAVLGFLPTWAVVMTRSGGDRYRRRRRA